MERNIREVMAGYGVEIDPDELAHYGVPGMKWGRRRKAKKEASAKAAAERDAVKTMSDEDLKARINRLKLEKEYRTLTAPEISAGRKIASDILKDVGKKQAAGYLNREIEKALTRGGAKAVGQLAISATKR